MASESELMTLLVIVCVVMICLSAFLVLYTKNAAACIVGSLLIMLVGLFFLSLWIIQIGVTTFVCGIVYQSNFPRRRRVQTAVAIFVIGVVAIHVNSISRMIHFYHLKAQHPFVSLRDRLQPLNSQRFLIDVKQSTDDESRPYSFGFPGPRQRAIGYLHHAAVMHFLSATDFGVLRMGMPDLKNLENADGSPITIPLSQLSQTPSESSDTEPQVLSHDELLEQQNLELQSWFLDASRMGVIEDADHVAGFLPHSMNENELASHRYAMGREGKIGIPGVKNAATLKLEKLQLVGLLYHEEPIAYVLDTMPSLLNAKTAPTRPLDNFEVRGIESLLGGEAIYCEQQGKHIRMIGAMRSAESCVQCHEGPTNQLLGAFTYTLSWNDSPDLVATNR